MFGTTCPFWAVQPAVTELQKVFERENIRAHAYDLNGSNVGEQYVMELRPDGWSVYYSERGGKNDEMWFDTEAEACRELMQRVLRDPTTRRRT